MNEPDAPRSASAEEEARTAETPALFANKVLVSPQPGGAKTAFAEARRASGEDLALPRVAVFPQHADLAVLRRLLDWTADAAARGKTLARFRIVRSSVLVSRPPSSRSSSVSLRSARPPAPCFQPGSPMVS